MSLRLILLLLFAFPVPLFAHSEKCDLAMEAMAPSPSILLSRAGYSALSGIGHGLKAMFYPFVYPVSAYHSGRASSAPTPWQRTLEALGTPLWKDMRHILGWGTLHGLGLTAGISLNEFHDETSEFDETSLEGLTVVVDAFPDNDLAYAGGGKKAFDALYFNDKNAVYLKLEGKIFS